MALFSPFKGEFCCVQEIKMIVGDLLLQRRVCVCVCVCVCVYVYTHQQDFSLSKRKAISIFT